MSGVVRSPPVAASGLGDTSALAGCHLRSRVWLILLVSDLLTLLAAIVAAVLVRLLAGGEYDPQQYLQLWPILVSFPLVMTVQGLYGARARSPAEELRFTVRSLSLVFLAAGAAVFLMGGADAWSRGVYVLAWLFSIVLVPVARAGLRMGLSSQPWYGRPTVILGAGKTGALVARQLQDTPTTGLRPVAILDDDESKWGTLEGIPVLGGLDLAPRLARECGIRHAVVAMPGTDHQRLAELERQEEDIFPHLVIIPPLVGFA
ncbi:MAG: undecaprenyl-phosphate galactose phosphotransferase WbaP, partial [Planctomycetota bacterium]|nr:undecaprenyl-phosphate galactose phosphotransferase WbaP [Planctomycetota bacterium]